jgi:hypothetical protein
MEDESYEDEILIALDEEMDEEDEIELLEKD